MDVEKKWASFAALACVWRDCSSSFFRRGAVGQFGTIPEISFQLAAGRKTLLRISAFSWTFFFRFALTCLQSSRKLLRRKKKREVDGGRKKQELGVIKFLFLPFLLVSLFYFARKLNSTSHRGNIFFTDSQLGINRSLQKCYYLQKYCYYSISCFRQNCSALKLRFIKHKFAAQKNRVKSWEELHVLRVWLDQLKIWAGANPRTTPSTGGPALSAQQSQSVRGTPGCCGSLFFFSLHKLWFSCFIAPHAKRNQFVLTNPFREPPGSGRFEVKDLLGTFVSLKGLIDSEEDGFPAEGFGVLLWLAARQKKKTSCLLSQAFLWDLFTCYFANGSVYFSLKRPSLILTPRLRGVVTGH